MELNSPLMESLGPILIYIITMEKCSLWVLKDVSLVYQSWRYAMNLLLAEIKINTNMSLPYEKKKKRGKKKPTPLSCFTNLWIQLIFNMEVKFPFIFFPFQARHLFLTRDEII